MSTSQKKRGIRCKNPHPDGNGPCDLLLMEERDGVVGIKDRNGHFASLTALNLVAMAHGWIPDTEQNEKEKTVTTKVRKSHRYADQGQIDALNKGTQYLPGDCVGRGMNTKARCNAGIVNNRLYILEQMSREVIYIRRITLPKGNEPMSGMLIRLAPTSLTELSPRDDRDSRRLYEHEAEELIEALDALPVR